MTPKPALPTLSEEVRAAVIEAYATLNSVPADQVQSAFDGGLAFDSILGVELACELEERLDISVPEDELAKGSVYKSLHTFSILVQQCLDRSRASEDSAG